ncbi:MAG: TonB family protein [candidate division Zixibacteria bacterium]|nr:TonB family protein [candidate division Zixibacteria bacterium]MDH3936713.1 TonB family protein [candidate division Zixibacteria bacterium]MDH4032566.1 TonB family protein [candidate division Zixibacteria bacterium]
MQKSTLLFSALFAAVICPLITPAMTWAESFEILFVFEDSKQLEGSGYVALVEGGYSAGHEPGMTGQILIQKSGSRQRKRDAKVAQAHVQDVSEFESSVLIEGLESHRIESKHTVDLDIPHYTAPELRQRADNYFVAGRYGIALSFYERVLQDDPEADSLELNERTRDCRNRLAQVLDSPKAWRAENERLPAYRALAWLYVGRGNKDRAAVYFNRMLKLDIRTKEAEHFRGVINGLTEEGRSGGDYLPTMTEFVPVDVFPQMIKQATPDYPPLAKLAGITGTVWVKSLVSDEGSVIGACIGTSSGHLVLDIAAAEAAYECKYKPAMQAGKPVSVWVVYSVDFVLD